MSADKSTKTSLPTRVISQIVTISSLNNRLKISGGSTNIEKIILCKSSKKTTNAATLKTF